MTIWKGDVDKDPFEVGRSRFGKNTLIWEAIYQGETDSIGGSDSGRMACKMESAESMMWQTSSESKVGGSFMSSDSTENISSHRLGKS